MSTPRLRAIFEVEVTAEVLRDFALADPLLPEEQAQVARAVDKRRREFAAGRSCARRALRSAGISAPGALPSLPDRRVAWPDGFTGSISHADGVAAAVVVPLSRARSVGLDVEAVGRLGPKLYGQIASAEEVAWIRAAGPAAEGERATQLFSAKEAFYKAQYPLTESFLGFHDVRYAARGAEGFEIEVLAEVPELLRRGGRFAGRLLTHDRHVWAGVTFLC